MRDAVLFDLDGTLIDSLPNITDAANAVLIERGLPTLTSSVTVGFVGRGEQVFVDRLIASTDLQLEDRKEILRDFVHHYAIEAEKTVCFEGVTAALQSLASEGYLLGLVTNKPRGPLVPTLEAAQLDAVFGVVVAGDDLATRKPDPAPLLHAMTELNASRCVYVGDSEVDAETAERADVPFVLYTEGIRTAKIDDLKHAAAFSRFENLRPTVEKLLA